MALRRGGLLVAVLAAVLGAAAGARAQAYVACFSAAALAGAEREVARLPAAPPAALVAACAARCASLRHPLSTLQLNGRCGCASAVPDAGGAVAAARCSEAVLAAADADAVALFYSHHDPTERCRLSNLGPLGASNVEASYNPGRMSFDRGQLQLALVGTDGARVHTADGDALYGLWQWDVEPSANVGALRSDYDQETKDYSEIDWEFINGGAAEQGPATVGSLWLNSYNSGTSYGERLVKPAAYTPLTGGALSTGGFRTYTIDWQPTHVSWKLDGSTLEHRTRGQRMQWQAWDGPKDRIFEPPSKPMHMTMSTWSHPIEGFGGANQGATATRYRALRRVLCGAPLPGSADAPLPAWLGGAGAGAGAGVEDAVVTPPVTGDAGGGVAPGPQPPSVLERQDSLDRIIPPLLVAAAGGDEASLRLGLGRIALEAVAAVMPVWLEAAAAAARASA
ncbi:hypothetical protein Rsub_06108 [Raphidocelis subcapitata]|uniref:GH16 domain-containing protein n=1 Tax=Raphidocelis subcapitata TaxID=307507 RepID=A0A2V0P1M9_9CHLO|nr:hypothetical protein Rsub_06108 [Raphidocelis subcapitata]|eukprot:GBF93776.1 hypothetical protein Rsub_06108 [Raphidocelis subcapitata]